MEQNDKLKAFLNEEENAKQNETPKKEEVVIKPHGGLIEVKSIDKKIITEDGRQLLI